MRPSQFSIRISRIFGLACAGLLVATLVPVELAGAATQPSAGSIKPFVEIPRTVSAPLDVPPTTAQCVANTHPEIVCLSPSLMHTLYDTDSLLNAGTDGTGQTIAIIDCYGSPTIRRDLKAFDTGYGLAAPPSFTIIQPAGPVPAFNPNDPSMVGWATETSLDVEWAHAMAPGASIVLAETPTAENFGMSGFKDIATAENDIITNHLATVISESFGTPEQTFRNDSLATFAPLEVPFAKAAAAGITILAATGDFGATGLKRGGTSFYQKQVVNWPASDPGVTAIGGSHLQLDTSGQRDDQDVVWNESFKHPQAEGAGKSAVFSRPSYQDGVAKATGRHRAIPDVVMAASCGDSVVVHLSSGVQSGWWFVCGTSEATPLFAGIVAMADQVAGHGLGQIDPALYSLLAAPDTHGVTDITLGDNSIWTKADHVVGFYAGAGYDVASGIGTIDGAKFVPALASAAG